MDAALVGTFFQTEIVYDRKNYRGIHVTSQISKVAERVIASLFVAQLICIGAYGRNQFAYVLERRARDALAQLVLKWISMMCKQRKIAFLFGRFRCLWQSQFKTIFAKAPGTRNTT